MEGGRGRTGRGCDRLLVLLSGTRLPPPKQAWVTHNQSESLCSETESAQLASYLPTRRSSHKTKESRVKTGDWTLNALCSMLEAQFSIFQFSPLIVSRQRSSAERLRGRGVVQFRVRTLTGKRRDPDVAMFDHGTLAFLEIDDSQLRTPSTYDARVYGWRYFSSLHFLRDILRNRWNRDRPDNAWVTLFSILKYKHYVFTNTTYAGKDSTLSNRRQILRRKSSSWNQNPNWMVQLLFSS